MSSNSSAYSEVIPVILAGGSGARLWPISRKKLPKQFAPLIDQNSLFQETIKRAFNCSDLKKPIIICNQIHDQLVKQQLEAMNLSADMIICEPTGRNTAPAIALIALYYLSQNLDPILFVSPADHFIPNPEELYEAIHVGISYAAQGKMVTFGVEPHRVETGYGYIKCGSSLSDETAFQIEAFMEKPNLELAKRYVQSGQYYWNSGMFLFRASDIVRELEKFTPEILKACRATLKRSEIKNNILYLAEKEFAACPSDSIDCAIMERTKQGVMISLATNWSDVGSWLSLMECQAVDKDGNVLKGNPVVVDVKDSYVHSTHRKVVAIGVKDCVIVETKDAVLVVHKSDCQKIKWVEKALQE